MAAGFEVITQAAPTVIGTQDYTSTSIGAFKLALFYMSHDADSNEDTFSDDAFFLVGAVDASGNQWAITANSEDGPASTDCSSGGNASRVINAPNVGATGGGNGYNAEFDSVLSGASDGVRIDWTSVTNLPSNLQVRCVLFGGSDVSAVVGTETASTSIGGTATTSTSFEPDAVLMATWHTAFSTSFNSDYDLGLGVCVNDGSLTQGSIGHWILNNEASMSPDAIRSESYGLFRIGSGGEASAVEVTSVSSSEVEFTTRENTGGLPFGYVFLSFGGVWETSLEWVSTRTTTGDTVLSASHDIAGAMAFANRVTADNTLQTGSADAGVVFMAATDGTTTAAIANTMENTSDPVVSKSLRSGNFIELPLDDGTSGSGTVRASLNTSTKTLTYTDVDSSAREVLVWSFGEPALSDVAIDESITLSEDIVGGVQILEAVDESITLSETTVGATNTSTPIPDGVPPHAAQAGHRSVQRAQAGHSSVQRT